MVDVKKVAVVGTIIGTVTVLGFYIAKVFGIGYKPALTFEAPPRCGLCETLVLKGTFKKGWKPLVGVPVTIYASVMGVTAPLTTVTTNSKGQYNLSGVIGAEVHYTEYYGVSFSFWAEAIYEGERFISSQRRCEIFAEACMGPCGSTIPVAAGEALQRLMTK